MPSHPRALLACALIVLPLLAACSGDDGVSAASPTPAAVASPTAPPASSPTPAPATTAVPPEFVPMSQFLTQNMDVWQAQINARPQSTNVPIFGAHLLAANGNRGAALLVSGTMQSVDTTLDGFKKLGLQGATVTISFPLLNDDQPRAADYLNFFATVAQHVRDRGMTLTIEQHIAFSGTVFSPVQFDYRKLPFDQFVARFHDMTQKILDRVHPDYLTLLSEPDTFAKLTGYREAEGPQGAATWVGRVLQGLVRGKTKIGAGAGSWLPNAVEYDTAFAKLQLDYLDLHIYPLTPATIATAQQVADFAKSVNKPVVLDETWLYKIGATDKADNAFDASTESFRRDNFSFWQPFDSRFLGLVAQWARANNIAYVAPFWSGFFWGYVEYGPTTKDLPYQQLAAAGNQAANESMREGTFTATGTAYGAAIKGR